MYGLHGGEVGVIELELLKTVSLQNACEGRGGLGLALRVDDGGGDVVDDAEHARDNRADEKEDEGEL